MLGDHDEHRPFEDFAVRHVMGGLDQAESGMFRSHLLDCAECRARVGELRSIASELAEVERSERRERAVQKVETKQRSERPAPPRPTPDGPSRATQVTAVCGVLLIVVLSIWNFVLRGQNDGLRDTAAALMASAETVNFGDPWEVAELAAGHDAVARDLDGRLAVMVRGTDDGASYRISMFDVDGDRVRTDSLTSMDGQVRWFGGPFRDHVDRVDVTLGRGSGETVIFRALSNSLTD